MRGEKKMKRFMCLVLSILIMPSLCACGKADTAEPGKPAAAALPAPEAPEASSEAPTSEENTVEDPAWDQLESLGKVTTENGIFYVTITIPADMVGADTTQESLDAEKNEFFTSAKLNDDGSVTYKMTKRQHKAMLDEFTKKIDEGLQELVDNADYAFTKITHNANYSSFDAYLSTSHVGITESLMVLALYMYGGLYGLISGESVDNISVNFYSSDGSLISTANSSNMG
jgi:hypothetical protein